jgi:hypothetical protein
MHQDPIFVNGPGKSVPRRLEWPRSSVDRRELVMVSKNPSHPKKYYIVQNPTDSFLPLHEIVHLHPSRRS